MGRGSVLKKRFAVYLNNLGIARNDKCSVWCGRAPFGAFSCLEFDFYSGLGKRGLFWWKIIRKTVRVLCLRCWK